MDVAPVHEDHLVQVVGVRLHLAKDAVRRLVPGIELAIILHQLAGVTWERGRGVSG